MGKRFWVLFKKDCRMLMSGKFFLMALGFLVLYTAYVNLGYIRFMEMEIYQVYLYDPVGTQTGKSPLIHQVSSREALDQALQADANGVGLDAADGTVQVVLYQGAEKVDRHRADYALSLLASPSPDTPEATGANTPKATGANTPKVTGTNTPKVTGANTPKVIGTNTPEQKARREITCELLFFELAAVGFLGIAAVLFKEKSMGVIRVHGILPLEKNLFLLSKLAVFLLSDLCFAVLLTLLNLGLSQGALVLPFVLVQTAILSLIMTLTGLGCSLMLKDFRQFTLAYLVIAIFAATPVFLSANTPVKLDWIAGHPFYHLYMGLKNAYFGTPGAGLWYYAGAGCAAALLFLWVQLAFRREMRKEG